MTDGNSFDVCTLYRVINVFSSLTPPDNVTPSLFLRDFSINLDDPPEFSLIFGKSASF